MGKRVGFFLYTGDWLKDPELRFCSIFARGLLIDLLCLMYEACRQGELSKPDGSPRTDEEIVGSVSGSTMEEKLAALRELERSGVLKRNENTGVLYSKRMVEMFEVSRKRAVAGSKRGSKGAAKTEQNGKQTGSKSGGILNPSLNPSLNLNQESIHSHSMEDGFEIVNPIAQSFPDSIRIPFERWLKFRFVQDGRRMDDIRQEVVLKDLARRGDRAEADVELSIRVGAKNICDSSKDLGKRSDPQMTSDQVSYGERAWG